MGVSSHLIFFPPPPKTTVGPPPGSTRFLMTGSNVQSSLVPTFSAIRTPTFGVNFLAQALTESIETRMHFALSVLILLIRSQISPVFPDCTQEANMDTSTLGSDLIMRLDQSIRCLRVIRWLGRTRLPALPDARKLYVQITISPKMRSLCFLVNLSNFLCVKNGLIQL